MARIGVKFLIRRVTRFASCLMDSVRLSTTASGIAAAPPKGCDHCMLSRDPECQISHVPYPPFSCHSKNDCVSSLSNSHSQGTQKVSHSAKERQHQPCRARLDSISSKLSTAHGAPALRARQRAGKALRRARRYPSPRSRAGQRQSCSRAARASPASARIAAAGAR